MIQHTPTPWVVEVFDSLAEAKEVCGFNWAYDWDEAERGKPAAVWQPGKFGGCTGLPGCIETTQANAEFICRAVNSHAALVAALKQAREYIDRTPVKMLDVGESLALLRAIAAALAAAGEGVT